MKTCTKCQKNLEEDSFYKKTATRLQSYCKQCFNLYCMDRWTQKKKQAILDKGGTCLDCKNEYPYPVFDFHHLDPTQKDLDWTKMRMVNAQRLKTELEKCVLLCSNCHRIRHHLTALSS